MDTNKLLPSNKSNKIFVEMPLYVGTYDIDVAGHVNNVVYVRWIEDLRIKLFSIICDFKVLIGKGFYPVVTSTEIKYRKQLKIFDTPNGFMELTGYRHGIITLNSVIKLGDEISAAAEQKCVIVNLTTSKISSEKERNELMHEYIITKFEAE